MGRLIKIALIQQHASPDKTENTRRCAEAFENAARNGARIIVFAELAFTTFYPQQPASGDVLEPPQICSLNYLKNGMWLPY